MNREDIKFVYDWKYMGFGRLYMYSQDNERVAQVRAAEDRKVRGTVYIGDVILFESYSTQETAEDIKRYLYSLGIKVCPRKLYALK